jgi:hypothetical protein
VRIIKNLDYYNKELLLSEAQEFIGLFVEDEMMLISEWFQFHQV